VSIDMSAAFIKGVDQQLPDARVTFDKFHVIARANKAVDQPRRIEQRTEPTLKGLRWTLLKDVFKLNTKAGSALHGLITAPKQTHIARAWVYKEQLRQILDRRQINLMRESLRHWCTCVMRSTVEPMKKVATMVRRHFKGIVAWAQTRQTNGFLEAINGLFQAAKRRARGFVKLSTIGTVLFLIAG
jgi:transposase